MRTLPFMIHDVILKNILRKLYFDIFLCIFNCFSFLSMIIMRKKQKLHICYFHFFKFFFMLCTSILINESITMFGYSIQSSQINCNSVWWFLDINFWHFEHFVFNLLLRFSLSGLEDFLQTIASTYLKHLSDVGLKFSGWGRAGTSLIPRTHLILLITVIFNQFD